LVRDLNESKKPKHQQPSKCEPKKRIVFSIRKIIGVKLEKPNCEHITFHCLSCKKEFPIKEASFIIGNGEIIKNRRDEDVYNSEIKENDHAIDALPYAVMSMTAMGTVFALSLYCKDCVKKI
jgi:hypothetical protein